MKEWWNNLALREKQMLVLGAFAIGIFLIYILLWSPLQNKVSSLRNQIQHSQELLAWMKDADKQIQALEKNSQKKSGSKATGSILSIVQKQIKTSPVASDLSQLHQVENDSVELSFKKVNFDKLMEWLIPFTQKQGLVISQITVKPSGSAGIVAADLVLK